MLSAEHETLRTLFRNRPELAVDLAREVLGIEVPAHATIRCDSEDLTEVTSTEYRADLVIIPEVNNKPVFAIILEVQLGKDPPKRYSWPQYGSGLRARLKCRVMLLVVTPNPMIVRWASRPIELGPGSVFTPWVIGPRSIPVITDPKRAAKVPELAVLSAMAHGKGDVETAVRIAIAAAKGVSRMRNHEDFVLYNDLILSALSAAARKAFEMIPAGYQFKTPLIRKSIEKGVVKGRVEGRARGRTEGLNEGRTEGRAEGQALSILEVFKARRLAVSADQRKKILACRDRQQLATWLRRAVTVASAKELFLH
jgi:hypothetical protein